MDCASCGKPLGPDDGFCSGCGQPVERPEDLKTRGEVTLEWMGKVLTDAGYSVSAGSAPGRMVATHPDPHHFSLTITDVATERMFTFIAVLTPTRRRSSKEERKLQEAIQTANYSSASLIFAMDPNGGDLVVSWFMPLMARTSREDILRFVDRFNNELVRIFNDSGLIALLT